MEYLDEEWRPISGFSGYWISDYGRVYSERSDKFLRPSLVGNGYPGVVLYMDGVGYSRRVHQLIASAFLHRVPDGFEVNHDDGDKTYNYIKNLDWTTHSENLRHASSEGLRRRKFKHIEIVENGKQFTTIGECADYLDSNLKAVWAAINRETPHKGFTIRYVY